MSRKSAIICAPVLPEFDRESGSRRLFDWLIFLREQGWQVSFACRQAQCTDRYTHLLQQQGIATYTGVTAAKAEELFSVGRFDLAICAFWYLAEEYMPLIRAVSPDTRVIIDSIDLHFMRRSREHFCSANGNTPARSLDSEFGREMAREMNAYAAADAVLTVSRKEADLIDDLLSSSTPTFVAPDCEDLSVSSIPPEQRTGIVFIGNFRHPPNIGAVEHLLQHIVPRLSCELLEAHPVYVVGNGMTDKIQAMAAGHPHVRMVGWVPSVVPYLTHARVSVVPLLYGAGTKRKLIQALMVGTPSVATTVAVEGLGLRDDREVLVADDPELFARAIQRLVGDDEAWQRVADAGAAHIRRDHSRETAAACLRQAVEAAMQRGGRSSGSNGTQHDTYLHLLQRVCEEIDTAIPPSAAVAVVNRGDRRLLELNDRKAFDFPQSPDGRYAGHHPADSAEAISQVRHVVTECDCEYLVFPSSAFWWLEYYDELKKELEKVHMQIWSSEHCRIFRLARSAADTRHLKGSPNRPVRRHSMQGTQPETERV